MPSTQSWRPCRIAPDGALKRQNQPMTRSDVQTAPTSDLVHQNDDTLLIPRQSGVESAPAREDRWRPGAVIAYSGIDGLSGQTRALSTLAWIVPTLIAAVLGFVRTAWPGMSARELEVWGIASVPGSQILRILGESDLRDVAYQTFAWGWAYVAGTSDFALRVPSVVAMAAAAGLTAALGTRLANPRVGILAGLTLAISPTASRWGQDATSTALTLCLSVLATLLLVRLFDAPRWPRYVAYGVSVAVLGLSDPVALVLLPVHGVLVLTLRWRAGLGWAGAAMLGAAPTAALLILSPSPWAIRPPQHLGGTGIADALVTGVFGATLVGGMMIGVALLAASPTSPGVVVATYAVAPILGLVALAQVVPITVAQAAVWTLPAWACLAGLALGRQPVTAGLVVLLVIGLAGFGTQTEIRRLDGHGQAIRQLANTLAAQMATGDAIIYGPGDLDGLAGRDIVARYVPVEKRPHDLLVTRPPRSGGHLFASECAAVATCVADTPRIWMFRLDTPAAPLDGFPAAKDGLLRVRYGVEQTWSFNGATLYLFVAKPAGPDNPAPK